MIILTQNKQAIWNFDDISRLHVTGRGTGIQAVARNGSGGEVAQYRDREQATYVMEMLASAIQQCAEATANGKGPAPPPTSKPSWRKNNAWFLVT